MRFARPLIALSLALALTLPAQATAGRTPRLPDCATGGATVIANETARVYSLRGAMFACRYGATRRVRLGNDGECQNDFAVEQPRLAGRYVGWVSLTCNLDASDETVSIADLTTGRVKWTSVGATGDTATSSREVTTWIRDFEVAPTGTAAWVGVFDAGGDTTTVDSPLDLVQFRVLKRNSSDGSEIADEGQAIIAGSLGVGSGGFYHRKGDAAVFTPRPTTARAAGRTADGAGMQRTCGARRSRTLTASRDARVFLLPNQEIFACRYTRPRRVFLGTNDDCLDDSEAAEFRLAGRYVAYLSRGCEIRGDRELVEVKDLNTGERLHVGDAAAVDQPNTEGPLATLVRGLVVNNRGSVGWIGQYDTDRQPAVIGPGDQFQVRRIQAGEPNGGQVVDQGQDIDPQSLAKSRDGFYWLKGGVAQFATLR